MMCNEHHAAQALSNLKQFLVDFSENSPFVYWLSAPDMSRVAYVSPTYEDVWGRSREVLYAHPELWITYLHSEDQDKSHPIEQLAARLKEDLQSVFFSEKYRIIRPNGETRWILDRGFPVIDSNGTCIGVTGVAIDVSNERRYEMLLLEENKKAQKVNRFKTAFLADTQHDFRTAFMGILSLSDFMAEGEKDAAKKANLQAIAQSASSLLKQYDG